MSSKFASLVALDQIGQIFRKSIPNRNLLFLELWIINWCLQLPRLYHNWRNNHESHLNSFTFVHLNLILGVFVLLIILPNLSKINQESASTQIPGIIGDFGVVVVLTYLLSYGLAGSLRSVQEIWSERVPFACNYK